MTLRNRWLLGLSLVAFLGLGCTQKTEKPIVKTVLPNGLTVIVKTVPGTPVSAVHLLVGHRMAFEKNPGESNLVQMMLSQGAGEMDRAAIARHLEELGAQLKTYDNPYFPFDDYYNSRDFAYVRLKVLSENLEPALRLFATLVRHPTFPEQELARVKARVRATLQEAQVIPDKVARNRFYGLMFQGSPLAHPILGTLESVARIRREDLVRYHQAAYVPGNCILTVVSDRPADWVLQQVQALLGDWSGTPQLAPDSAALAPPEPVSVEIPVPGQRAYLYMGTKIPGLQSLDAPTLRVAALVLSDRMAGELREKRGLAYRLGAFTRFYSPGVGIFALVMGTSSNKYPEARQGMEEMLRSLVEQPPTEEEIRRVVNASWGSHLRYHQKKINQAYFLALYEYLGPGYEYDLSQIHLLRQVRPQDVVRVARAYLQPDRMVRVAAGGF